MAAGEYVSVSSQADTEAADREREMLELEIIPEKWITFDSEKSSRDRAGELREDEKTPRKSSDQVRMNAERARRGLPPR